MRIQLPSTTPAEVALSPGLPARGLVIAPDIFGLRPLFDGMCQRLAEGQGWAVCAVEPFPGRQTLTIEERQAMAKDLDDEAQLGDLVAAADHLLELGAQPVGVLGFCMGGMYTLKAAGTGRFDRAVAFYGMIRVPEAWHGPGQGEPLEALARPEAAPVLAIIGEEDPYTPPGDVEALEAIGSGVEVVRYAQAAHGFVHDPARPAHRPADAADAWERAINFLGAGLARGNS